MKFTYFNFDNKLIDINIGKITNIVGQNIYERDFFINCIADYFSSYKYSEYEEIKLNFSNIKINDEEVGRKIFKSYLLENNNLDNLLTFNKDSLLYGYMAKMYEDLEICKYIAKIDEEITKITLRYSHIIDEDMKNYINFKDIIIEEKILFKNFISPYINNEEADLKYMKNYEKLILALNLIKLINNDNNEEKLIIIKDIERIVPYEKIGEINDIIMELSNKNIKFIISSNKEGYIFGDEYDTEYINIFADILVTLPTLDFITDFINRNYPIMVIFTSYEIYKYIKKISLNLFFKNIKLGYSREDIFIKLINKSYSIENILNTQVLKEGEMNFLEKN